MGNIDWIPIAELPEEFKDGRALLLWGGKPDSTGSDEFDFDESQDQEIWAEPRPVSAWFEGSSWRFCSYDSGYYGRYEDPTHFAEINPPA